MLNVTPFILFDGNCAEAMAFYQKCFGGELVITTLGDTPMKAHVPQEMHHKVTNAHLKSGAIEFSATDWLHPTRKFSRGNSVAMYLNGGTYNELESVFDNYRTELTKNFSMNYEKCHLEYMGTSLTGTEFTGFSPAKSKGEGSELVSPFYGSGSDSRLLSNACVRVNPYFLTRYIDSLVYRS